jgi:serine-type D-Ala-D-Ala carboxypeptidase (penicillin-binding protein 5/6)
LAGVRRLLGPLLLALVLAPAASAQDVFPVVDARAVVVANGATGEVVYSRDPDARLAPASITKLMTALVVLDRARPGETVTVPAVASSVGESSIRLRPGERLPVRDLLAAALIQSANDAAYALAAHAGDGSVERFVRLMNAKARSLGLANTRFTRPDGLDDENHYSTAADLLVLARTAMRRPLIRELVRRRTLAIAGGRQLFPWNDLLGRYAGLVGVKTGHTAAAGWCQVAAARRDGVTMYAVVLGSPSRAQRNEDLAELLDWGFGQYVRTTVVQAERTYATAALPFGEERLALVAGEPARAVVRMGRPLLERVVAPAIVDLPVTRGERLGEVRILEGDRVVARRPLVASRTVEDPSFGARASWYAGRAVDEVGGMVEGLLGAVL